MLSILFGLISALSWGAGDFTGGLSSRRVGALRAVLYADAVGILVLLAAVGVTGEAIPAFSAGLWALLAGVVGTIGLVLLYHAMSTGKMSIAAPVSALLAAALPVTVGILTQGWPGPLALVGFALALAAVWLVSADGSAHFHIERLSDLRLPLLAGLAFGAYFVLIHQATSDSTYWPMVFSRTAGTLLVLGILLVRRESTSAPRSAWGLIVANGFLDVCGNVFYVLAAQAGRMDVAAVLASLYPGGTALLAWLFLKEKINRTQLVGIGLALVAIVLMTV